MMQKPRAHPLVNALLIISLSKKIPIRTNFPAATRTTEFSVPPRLDPAVRIEIARRPQTELLSNGSELPIPVVTKF